MKTSKNENDLHTCRCTVADHRRAALIALSRAALELDELREARHRAGEAATAADELAEHIDSRLFDEADALGMFEEEYDCGCGHADEEEVGDAARVSKPCEPGWAGQGSDCAYTDEHTVAAPVSTRPRLRRRASFVSRACAVLSLGFALVTVLTSDASEEEEIHE